MGGDTRGWSSAILVGMVNVMGGLIFGWVAIGSNTAAGLLWPCMYDSYNSWKNSALQSMVNVGAAAGSLGGGAVWSKLGFKKGLLVGSLLSCGSVWTMFAYSYAQQVGARILTGLGIGIISSCAPEYVGQMSKLYFESDDAPTGRIGGRLGCLFQVAVTFGILLSNIAGYFLLGSNRDDGSLSNAEGSGFCQEYEDSDPHWYRKQNTWLFLPGLCISGLTVLLSFIIEESPTWKFRDQQGYQRADVEYAGDDEQKEPTPRRTWILGVMGCVALQLTGINAVMFYSGKFFDAANYKHKIFGSVLVMAWNFVTTLIALVLVNKFGRRGLMMRGLFLIMVSITLLTPFDQWVTNDSVKAAMCFVCLGVYILGFEMGPGCLFWVYLPEVAPEGSPLFPFANALQWTFTLIVTFMFPPLQDAVDGYVFWFFAVPAILAFGFHLVCLPETGGDNPQENQRYAKDMLRNDDGTKPWNVPKMEKGRADGSWVLSGDAASMPGYDKPYPDDGIGYAQ
eukprot:TRINITY_DN7721_c0_g1_i1.p2 TRINITY_DN7721_c0_g1~~TRINITY_DN7721_c0_g1_i1.p2  ORF type:complete len:535 (+),score=203.79 TRINITY_DN7721_c0_g1_i1:82-1605(+)